MVPAEVGRTPLPNRALALALAVAPAPAPTAERGVTPVGSDAWRGDGTGGNGLEPEPVLFASRCWCVAGAVVGREEASALEV